MSVVEIIFSPTGGTEKVSGIICEQLDGERKRIDLCDVKTDFSQCMIDNDDNVLISMPVFASRPPAVAIERLKQINGNGAKCSLVCVYGNGDYGNSLAEMKDAAQQSGFQVIAAIAAIAQHSIIPEYASGRPDEKDKEQLVDFANLIKNKKGKISSELNNEVTEEADDNESEPAPPSEPPLPKPDETCIKCGVCLEKCPLQAISLPDFNADINKCIFCMRCLKQCPNESRKVNEEVISNAALALKEICSIRKENELFL